MSPDLIINCLDSIFEISHQTPRAALKGRRFFYNADYIMSTDIEFDNFLGNILRRR